jgi:hypothetical protein
MSRWDGPLGGVAGGAAAWVESPSCSELAPRDREGVEVWLGPSSISGMSVGGGWEGRIRGGSGRSDESVELTVLAGELSPISGLSLDLDTDLDLCRPAEGYNADGNRSSSSSWIAKLALPVSFTTDLISGWESALLWRAGREFLGREFLAGLDLVASGWPWAC